LQTILQIVSKPSEFKKSLGLLDAILLVSGSMIGSGIFIVTAGMSRDLGSAGWILVAWLVSGLLTVMAALSYGELSAMMPDAGGQYVYLQRAFGRLTAFLYGWTVFTVIQTGVIAAVAVAFAKFSAVFFPALSPQNVLIDAGIIKINAAQLLAIASILFLTWLNARGVKDGKLIQFVFTSAKLIALFALIIFGLWVGFGSDAWSGNFSSLWDASRLITKEGVTTITPLSGWSLLPVLGVAMVGSLFSSDAWNNVTFIAGEIRNPGKNLPLSLFIGTLIVTSIYMLANLAYLALLPMQEIQAAAEDRVGTAAAKVIFGDSAVYLMAGLIMISTFGCNNGIIMAGGRLFYAMAKDGLFFKSAAELNRNAVPGFALWIQAAWASVLCLSGKYGDLLEYTTFASLLFYIVTIAGLLVLRKREPLADRPYKVFLYPWLPILYIVFAAAFCLNLLVNSPQFTLAGIFIVALGFPVYFLTRSKSGGAA
jgi:APA family basic amino acid/polyamine antiporter